jgi:hypothetical protein
VTADPIALGPADDDFHEAPDGIWWFHETCWYWFHVPERGIGGWLYNWIRPNIGVSGGGCWVWDHSAHLHWEVPYYANHSNLRLPAERDLRDFRFPSGVQVTMLEPLRRYALSYADADQIELALVFDAVDEPWVSTTVDDDGVARPHHFDQLGRVTGRLVLHGETMQVDCLAIRDRTWTPRSERWRDGGGYGYTNAAADSGEAFLAVGTDAVRGYLTLDGRRGSLVSGTREVLRRAASGAPEEVAVHAVDDTGRTLEARGTAVSTMMMPIPGVHALVWTSLMSWTINGSAAWGEDQEPWPIARWSRDRRSGLV